MPQLFFPPDAAVKSALIRWALAGLPMPVTIAPETAEVIGVTDATRSRLFTVVVYHNYIPSLGHMELTAVSKAHPVRWCNRSIIAGLLHYPFGQLGIRKLIVHTAPDSVVNRLASHVGMTCEATLRHHYAHRKHAKLWSMTDREYRTSQWVRAEQREAA